MDLESLEEALEDLLPAGFSVETDKNGQVVIFTGLKQDDDGELVSFDDADDEDFDPDFEPLEDDSLDD